MDNLCPVRKTVQAHHRERRRNVVTELIVSACTGAEHVLIMVVLRSGCDRGLHITSAQKLNNGQMAAHSDARSMSMEAIDEYLAIAEHCISTRKTNGDVYGYPFILLLCASLFSTACGCYFS